MGWYFELIKSIPGPVILAFQYSYFTLLLYVLMIYNLTVLTLFVSFRHMGIATSVIDPYFRRKKLTRPYHEKI